MSTDKCINSAVQRFVLLTWTVGEIHCGWVQQWSPHCLQQLCCHWRWFNECDVVVVYWCAHFLSYTLVRFWYLAVDVHHPPCVRCPATKLSDCWAAYFMILRAIGPPARNECAPIMSGSIPRLWSFSAFAAVRTALTISELCTEIHAFSWNTSQISCWSVPTLLKMWCTLRAINATDPHSPVVSWCSVCPVRLYFWFAIFIVAESAVSSFSNGDLRDRIVLSFQNPTSQTLNWTVLVALTIFPLPFTFRGFAYSPLRKKK